jgi:hypothetical protein
VCRMGVIARQHSPFPDCCGDGKGRGGGDGVVGGSGVDGASGGEEGLSGEVSVGGTANGGGGGGGGWRLASGIGGKGGGGGYRRRGGGVCAQASWVSASLRACTEVLVMDWQLPRTPHHLKMQFGGCHSLSLPAEPAF